MWQEIVIGSIAFLVLCFILMKFVFPQMEKTFAARVDAIEGGIKLIRKYQYMNGKPKRYKIICFSAAFHGRLLNALAATGNEKYLEGFGPPAPGYRHAPLNNTNVVRDMVDDETAGILVEPIQGEGGIRATTTQFLKDLRAICDEFGLLLFYD